LTNPQRVLLFKDPRKAKLSADEPSFFVSRAFYRKVFFLFKDSVGVNRFLTFSLILFLIFLSGVFSQASPVNLPTNSHPFDFYERGPYRSELVRPSDFFGYNPGEFLTTFALYESLLREYGRHSDRLRIFPLGKTPEHRTLYLLAISSPTNLAHLDQIKENLAKLADPRNQNAGDLESVIHTTPIAVWLSYSIHGNESAAFEAGIQVLYQLLASEDRAIQDALDHTIVLINPCQNPDGHERFATWYNAHGDARPEHYAYEHDEPWSIQGRLNHNFFDLNRDLISLSQPESQVATRAFLEWHPQVLADHHGQTKEYFFPPPALPINPNLPPKTTTKWVQVFGKANAGAFDRYGWPYFVREMFDLFYPGYWDTWSSLHGATGMTYETDGGGPLGYRWYRDDGTVLTLRDGISKHFIASLSTVFTAAQNREARLRDYRDFFESSVKSPQGKRYFIADPNSPAATELVGLLQRQGIEVSRTNREILIATGTDRYGRDFNNRTFPAGSYMVDSAQPFGRMATTLLDFETPEDPEFLTRQEKLRRANETKGTEESKEDYEFYDVTSWSLPLAMGVETYSTDQSVPADMTEAVDNQRTASNTQIGAEREGATKTQLSDGVAYVFESTSPQSMRMVVDLLQRGYRIETSNDIFRAAGQDYPRGSFILREERNPADLSQILKRCADEYRVPVKSISSSLSDDNGPGIGSEKTFSLKIPKVAILAGEPANQTSYGLLRFVLEQKYGLDLVPVPSSNLTKDVFRQLNILILPNGEASDYKKKFDEERLDDLRDWISQGGVLICMGGASEFAADAETKLTSSRILGAGEKSGDQEKPGGSSDKSPEERAKKEKEPAKRKGSRDRKPLEVPGAIVRAHVNRDHFLTIGYGSNDLPLLVRGNTFFERSDTGANVLTFDGDKLKISGFFWEGNTEESLRGTAALIEEPIDNGHVVLFNSEPGFRMIWTSSVRLLLNAIVYGPSQPNKNDR
jgi:zinc carboxypeptidase